MRFNNIIKPNLLFVTVIMLACLVFGIEASMPPSGPVSAYAENLTNSNETNATNIESLYVDSLIGNNTTNETVAGSAYAAILSMTSDVHKYAAYKSLSDCSNASPAGPLCSDMLGNKSP
jgi:hypothetical protein